MSDESEREVQRTVGFSVDINGARQFCAGVDGKGHFGVHVVRGSRSDGLPYVRGAAYREIAPHETEHLTWARVQLQPGDVVTVRCSSTEPASEPETREFSRDDERICLHDRELARGVAELVAQFHTALQDYIPQVEATGSPEDTRKFTRAVGYVLAENFDRLLTPIYNRHPDLGPRDEG